MANEYSGTTWKLDTAGVIMTGPVKIRRMKVVGGAAGDDVLVSDAAGSIIWELTNLLTGGLAGSEEIDFGAVGLHAHGFTLTTLTAGATLYVWLL